MATYCNKIASIVLLHYGTIIKENEDYLKKSSVVA